jgi:glutamate/tyrosine decarboxylase-like PLP-dependent enzyme
MMDEYLEAVERWRSSMPGFEQDGTQQVSEETLKSVFSEYFERVVECYPFFSPLYAGQMVKPPHPVATLAYMAAMHINPNNHALDGGPATSSMEVEAVEQIAQMFEMPQFLGHLSASGTIANLEALWIARCLHPDKAIAFSRQCHYTHPRLCEVIGAQGVEIENDECGRLDLADLETKLEKHNIGTVVATVGTTGLGALDPAHELVRMKSKYGFRVHADAAYGGFFRLLAGGDEPLVDAEPFKALKDCDSIVIDPHKHGLQPYGCGCVLFSDPSVGRFHKHDSPYTYFTSKELHLGEISLECSRAGAAAAALWVTLKCLPLASDKGFGPILAKCRQAALKFHRLIEEGKEFEAVVEPELDIVAYFPRPADLKASGVTELSNRLFEAAMNDTERPLYVARMKISPPLLGDRFGDSFWDAPEVTVLRSVLMKPEHLEYAEQIYRRLAGHLRKIGK